MALRTEDIPLCGYTGEIVDCYNYASVILGNDGEPFTMDDARCSEHLHETDWYLTIDEAYKSIPYLSV